jgi:hypothetical protein
MRWSAYRRKGGLDFGSEGNCRPVVDPLDNPGENLQQEGNFRIKIGTKNIEFAKKKSSNSQNNYNGLKWICPIFTNYILKFG